MRGFKIYISAAGLKIFYFYIKIFKFSPFKYTRDADNFFKYKKSDSDQKKIKNLKKFNPGSETKLLNLGPRIWN